MTQTDYISIQHDDIQSRSPSPEATSTPTPRRQSYDLKRNAVPVACLRCRRRKVRCSGLPGPCVTCARFGVACVDPGKRRARSKSTSGAPSWDAFSLQQPELEIIQPSPRPGQLHINTSNLFDPMHSFNDDLSYPVSPACYSDVGPELVWPPTTPDIKEDFFGGIARAQTFPNHDTTMYEEPLHSPIPSIQITSHEGSISGSPMLQPTYDMPTLGFQQDLPTLQVPIATSMDYYSDYLSPTDAPPAVSRRASITSVTNFSSSHVADWTQRTAPTKRRHTTCSLSNPRTVGNTELTWMLNSPRTTNYLTHYMTHIHPMYPFLDDPTVPQRSETSPYTAASSALTTYRRLLTAAIGALHQHKSRDIAARYVRHAMALQKSEGLDETLFASISGTHGALLLGIYLLLESQMTFEHEEEDTSHPEVNLWLWDCRVASACIDLGLHEWPKGGRGELLGHAEAQERQVAVLCLNTFRSAWRLDREISQSRKRPRAWHEADVDGRLWQWVVEQELDDTVGGVGCLSTRQIKRERAAEGNFGCVGIEIGGLAI